MELCPTADFCAVSDCMVRRYALGYCRPHYLRFKRHGDPLGGRNTVALECKVPGCTGKSNAHDFCGMHANRFKRHGDPLGGRTFNGDMVRWLEWLTVNQPVDPNECVDWPFPWPTTTRPRITYKKRRMPSTHVALLVAGVLPETENLHALHRPVICHNERCHRHDHLYWGTRIENMADRVLDGTANRGKDHYRTKLTVEDVRAIRTDLRTQKVIAADYGVDQGHISHIINRKAWKWLE